jgi:solute carrier family 25 carnitine/acylcarnitine transporter 20/29
MPLVPCFPLLLCQARLQIQYNDPTTIRYRGPIDCVRQLVRNNGLRGLYIGGSGTILFRLHMSFYFAGTELLKRRLSAARPLWSDMTLNFLCGGMGANLYWCIAFPSDTIKNKMMAQPDTVPRRYPTLLSCYRDIMRTEGFKGFYRGFVPCILRSFPTNGAAFVAAETMLKILPQ